MGAPAPAEPVPQLPVIQPQPPVSGQQPTQPGYLIHSNNSGHDIVLNLTFVICK